MYILTNKWWLIASDISHLELTYNWKFANMVDWNDSYNPLMFLHPAIVAWMEN